MKNIMDQQTFLALELFHVLCTNKICYIHRLQSWIGDNTKEDFYVKISFQHILKYSAFILSGITKERADTRLTKTLLEQIESWSAISEAPPVKVFNPDLGAFRYMPQSLVKN